MGMTIPDADIRVLHIILIPSFLTRRVWSSKLTCNVLSGEALASQIHLDRSVPKIEVAESFICFPWSQMASLVIW